MEMADAVRPEMTYQPPDDEGFGLAMLLRAPVEPGVFEEPGRRSLKPWPAKLGPVAVR